MIETKTLQLPKTQHQITYANQDGFEFHKVLEEIILMYILLDELDVGEDSFKMENIKTIYYSFKTTNKNMSFTLFVGVNKLQHNSNHCLAGCFYLENLCLAIVYNKDKQPKIISELENTSIEKIYSLNSNEVRCEFESIGDDEHLILIKALKEELMRD